MLADAKYYAASYAGESPGVADIVKQQAYERAIEFIDGKPLAGNMFIFPASQSGAGKFTHIEFRTENGARADTFPLVSCLYLSVHDVLQHYVKDQTFVERQPPCPRATTILAGFQAAEVGVSFNVSG
jgi:hypothetical protein